MRMNGPVGVRPGILAGRGRWPTPGLPWPRFSARSAVLALHSGGRIECAVHKEAMIDVFRFARFARYPLCAQPHRLSAPGQCAHRAAEFPRRPQGRRALHPARRGHRRGALQRRFHDRPVRRPALAGHRLGRGAGHRRPARHLSPAAAPGHLRRVAVAAGCGWPDLSLLLHARRAEHLAQAAARRWPAAALCRHLPQSHAGRAR